MVGMPRDMVPSEPFVRWWRDEHPEIRFKHLTSDFGVSGSTLKRWLRGGQMNALTADRLAVFFHVHPVEIWGDAWWSQVA